MFVNNIITSCTKNTTLVTLNVGLQTEQPFLSYRRLTTLINDNHTLKILIIEHIIVQTGLNEVMDACRTNHSLQKLHLKTSVLDITFISNNFIQLLNNNNTLIHIDLIFTQPLTSDINTLKSIKAELIQAIGNNKNIMHMDLFDPNNIIMANDHNFITGLIYDENYNSPLKDALEQNERSAKRYAKILFKDNVQQVKLNSEEILARKSAISYILENEYNLPQEVIERKFRNITISKYPQTHSSWQERLKKRSRR